jgi:glucose-6-phosphate 1-epimerase
MTRWRDSLQRGMADRHNCVCELEGIAGRLVSARTEFVTMIHEWNERFGIPGVAEVVPGNGGLAMVRVSTDAARAEIYLHGAQVTSWRPVGEDEVLFVSDQSLWVDGKAIRGGIPICFPWFRGKADDAKAPAHGVVRTKEWELTGLALDGDAVTAMFETENDEVGRRWWPHEFRAEYRVRVGKELGLALTVVNTGGSGMGFSGMRFEEALHTYHRVSDAEQVRVTGLDGTAYLDNMDGNREKRQTGDVMFRAQTDNAYLDTRETLEVVDPVLRRRIRTEKGNSQTTVVWNPWREGAKALADLGDEEWRGFACVEASNILSYAVELGAGERHTMTAVLSVAR